jgi:hypothetical protein
LDNATIQSLEWEKARIEELDIRATELDAETLISLLTRLPHLRCLLSTVDSRQSFNNILNPIHSGLDASWLEYFTDQAFLKNFDQRRSGIRKHI